MLWMVRVWFWLPSAFPAERKRLRRGWRCQGRMRLAMSGSDTTFVAFIGFRPRLAVVGGLKLLEVNGIRAVKGIFGAVDRCSGWFDILAEERPVVACDCHVAAAGGEAAGHDGLGVKASRGVSRNKDHEGHGLSIDDLLAGDEGHRVRAVVGEPVIFAHARHGVRCVHFPSAAVDHEGSKRVRCWKGRCFGRGRGGDLEREQKD